MGKHTFRLTQPFGLDRARPAEFFFLLENMRFRATAIANEF